MKYIIEVPVKPLTPTQQLLNKYNDGLPVLTIGLSFVVGIAFIGQMAMLISNNTILKTLRLKDISTFLTAKDLEEQQTMKTLLTELRLLGDSDRSSLELAHDGVKFDKANVYKKLSIVYESINPKIKSTKDRIKDIPVADIFSEILLQQNENEKDRFYYIVRSKQTPEYQASLDAFGIEALLTRVLRNDNGNIIGAIHLEWIKEPTNNPMILKFNEINKAFNVLNYNIQHLIKGKKLSKVYTE
jgi:hypothetical protein